MLDLRDKIYAVKLIFFISVEIGIALRMQQPASFEQYVTVVDNKGREKVQFVEYIVDDVRGEKVYVTTDGLMYAQDSLTRKGQEHVVELFDRIPTILSHPEIVIQDHWTPDDTRLYYKHTHIVTHSQPLLLCVVVKIRQGICFFYNFFPQQSGKVKGYLEIPPPAIWYIAPTRNPRQYGLASGDVSL